MAAWMVIVAVLVAGQFKGEMSPFDPKQVSSEAKWVGVNSCLKTMPKDFAAQHPTSELVAYCACGADVTVVNGTKKAAVKDLQACAELARKAGPDPRPKLGPKDWSTERIFAQVNTCTDAYSPQATAQYGGANVMWSWCACYVDGMRAKGEVSLDDVEFCRLRAAERFPAKK